ncbi:MAG: nickel transporter [Cytophagaceae bacterium]|nr:nickel transporter [Gemmatimonadaceae bacterium]
MHGPWLLSAALTALITAPLGAQGSSRHPLDPLTAAEIRQAVTLLGQSGRVTPHSRYATIAVQPRRKAGGESRAARVVGYDWSRHEGFVAVVDLGASRVESWTPVDGEPPMRLLTIRRAEEIAQGDPRVVAALRRRGIDPARVNILPGGAERSKLVRRDGDRVVLAKVFLRDGLPPALDAEGLTLLINLTRARVDSIVDDGSSGERERRAVSQLLGSARPALPPLEVRQRLGTAVRVAGNVVTWDRWRFRVGIDPRSGLEVHDVAFRDGERWRPVLYSGSTSEIVAPYGDPAFGTWYPRDEGDYGMGIYGGTPAVTLNDAPANAVFLASTMHDHLGRPVTLPRAISIYEQDGGILWRHSNESRRARQLVVSGQSAIDNYDYQFSWIFGQDGTIECQVLLSGIMNTNPTPRMRDTAHAAGHEQYSHLVAPGVNAPNHQHFFAFRLDLDVDGPVNTVYAVDTRAAPDERNPKGELFSMRETPLATERQGIADVSFATARTWRVANPRQLNALGQFTAYTLAPGTVSPVFARPGSAPLRTAGFMAHQLWVTPFSPGEWWAGGELQNLGRDGEGLPSWTAADRSIRDTDVVLWHTLGITHIPRPEDWPLMPAHRGGFRLVPTGFFARNPALDVPATRR